MEITWWPSIYDKTTHERMCLTWDEFVQRLSTHTRTSRKDLAPGFGPYALKAPSSPQDASEAQRPHRSDSWVENLTAAVFDADMGTAEDVANTDSLLGQVQCARLWYSTYNHKKGKPSYRLAIPLLHPVRPEAWPALRLGIIRQFQIPCDAGKCSGKSHFYYAPSCPLEATPEVWSASGKLLDATSISLVEPKREVRFATLDGFAWKPPPEQDGPVDLVKLRGEVHSRVRGLTRKGETRKANALLCLLKGEPLAQKGSRNETTFKVAGVLAWALPNESLGTLVLLMRPSVEAMVSQGSSLSMDAVERMLETAMRAKAESDYLQRTSRENMHRELESFRANLFRAAGLGVGKNESNEAS